MPLRLLAILLFIASWFWTSCLTDKPTKPPVEEPDTTMTPEEIQAMNVQIVRNLLDVNGMQSRSVDEVAEWSGDYITRIDLSGSQVTLLTDSLAKMKNLTELLLNDVFLTELGDSLMLATNLKRLELRNARLDTLPDSLHLLKNLEVLDLGHNQLKSLPRGIGRLEKLVHLYLDENQLERLPDSLDGLTSLQTLTLDRNQLATLSAGLGAATELRTLTLNHNQLTDLPPVFENLTKLSDFQAASNQLREFPEELAQATLSTLILDDNELTALPPLHALNKLTKLSFPRNRIRAMPEGIEAARGLRELYMQNNQIPAFSPGMGQLSNLKTLIAGNNLLTQIPYDVSNWADLRSLNLAENRFVMIPDALTKLSQLEILILTGNPDLCALNTSQQNFVSNKANLDLDLCSDSIRVDSVFSSGGTSDWAQGRVYRDTLPFDGAGIFLFTSDRTPLVNQPEIVSDTSGRWQVPLSVGSYTAAAFYLEDSTLTPWTACYSEFAISGSQKDTLKLPGFATLTAENKQCNSYIPFPGETFDIRLEGFVDTQLTVDLVSYPLNAMEAEKVAQDLCGLQDSGVVFEDSGSYWIGNWGESFTQGDDIYWEYQAIISTNSDNPRVECRVNGDGLDNDGDGCHDEEVVDGMDNDGDGYVDEDARLIPYASKTVLFNELVHADSLSGDTVFLKQDNTLSYLPDTVSLWAAGDGPEMRRNILELGVPKSGSGEDLDSAINNIGGCWSFYPSVFGN